MKETLDKLNDSLMAGLNDPQAQFWVDKCFDMVTDFAVTHGPLEFPDMVPLWPEGAGTTLNKSETMLMFFDDLHYNLEKRNLL